MLAASIGLLFPLTFLIVSRGNANRMKNIGQQRVMMVVMEAGCLNHQSSLQHWGESGLCVSGLSACPNCSIAGGDRRVSIALN